MASYKTDGVKLLDVEYDFVAQVGDTIDDMRVVSVDIRSSEEMGFFLVDHFGRVMVYVFDETYLVGKSPWYETLPDAIEAWNDGEI